jgi:DNA-binding response OmpR family regulator
MTVNIRPTHCSRRRNPLPDGVSWSHRAEAGAGLEFGRFRVLLRRRQLLADGVPVELGTRAFDLLLVLLKARGALVSKEELLSRVWPDVVVSEENVKAQVAALRKALGADRVSSVRNSAAVTDSLACCAWITQWQRQIV